MNLGQWFGNICKVDGTNNAMVCGHWAWPWPAVYVSSEMKDATFVDTGFRVRLVRNVGVFVTV